MPYSKDYITYTNFKTLKYFSFLEKIKGQYLKLPFQICNSKFSKLKKNLMMPFWPKASSQHFNKLKNAINFTITKVVTCNWYTIEMILMVILCKNDVLQNYDPPPQLVM